MHKPCVDTVDVDFRRKGLFFFFLVVRNVVVIVLRGVFFSVLADFEGQGHKKSHNVPNVCELLRNIFVGVLVML